MPAASGRTTAPKSNVVDFDAERKKGKKRKPKLDPLRAFGQEWQLHRPNIALVGDLLDSERLGALGGYIAAHVVVDQREDFVKALMADEDFDEDDLLLLSDQVTKAVNDGLPSGPS